MSDFLDTTGLTYFWGKVKAHVASVLNPHFGTCSTLAGTAAKTVTIDGINELTVGLTIMVKFLYSNSKASPTLKVNNLDAKSIMRYGTTAPGTSVSTSWNEGSVVIMVYDGAYWQICNFLNSTYTIPSAMTDPEMKAGTATTGRTLTAVRLKNAIQYHSADLLTWNLLGEYTGVQGSAVELPDDFHEALVVIEPSTGYRLSFIVPNSTVYFNTSSDRYLTNNYSSDYNGWTRFDLLQDPTGGKYVNLNAAYSGSTNITNIAKWWVLYR